LPRSAACMPSSTSPERCSSLSLSTSLERHILAGPRLITPACAASPPHDRPLLLILFGYGVPPLVASSSLIITSPAAPRLPRVASPHTRRRRRHRRPRPLSSPHRPASLR
jgi:hypothetical protein